MFKRRHTKRHSCRVEDSCSNLSCDLTRQLYTRLFGFVFLLKQLQTSLSHYNCTLESPSAKNFVEKLFR